MPKVVVELERAWTFWPTVASPTASEELRTIELSSDFLDECERVSRRHRELQEHLEHCYRHQRRLHPYQDSPFASEDKQ